MSNEVQTKRIGIDRQGVRWRLLKTICLSALTPFAMYVIEYAKTFDDATVWYEYNPLGWTDNGPKANAVFNRIIE